MANISLHKPRLLGLVLGSLTGAIAGVLIVVKLEPVFSMPNEFADYPIQPSVEYMVRYHAALRFMYSGNFAIYFAILGMAIGIVTGIGAGGKHRRSATLLGGLYGCVFGALGGSLSGLSVAFAIQNSGKAIPFFGLEIEPIVQSTAMQCFAWAFVAIGVGWGFSVATGRSIGTGIQIGLIGGCLIGVGYTLIEGICFPSANGFLIVPISMFEKLTWAAFAGLSIGSINSFISSKQTQI